MGYGNTRVQSNRLKRVKMSYQNENCPKLKAVGIGSNTIGLKDVKGYANYKVVDQGVVDRCLKCPERVCLLTLSGQMGRPKKVA